MKYTSAEAAKLLRKLNDEHNNIRSKEDKTCTFIAAIEEDIDSVRPGYNYKNVQEKLNEIEEKVRKVKHAINMFNLTTEVPGFDMTVDQMLVYIPQLNARKQKLAYMAIRLPKERVSYAYGSSKNMIEYTYANYDIAQAEADLNEVTEELARAQTALDVVNNKETLEIDI